MDYSIPWDLLPEDDAEFFERNGIERGPAFLKFRRDLTRVEVASLCERLWNFRSIIPAPEENHINFAIGEALHEFSRLFGEEDGEHFMRQWERFATIRDTTLKITGGALIYLQTVEHQIKGCCAILNLQGSKLTLEDFQSQDSTRRRQTLGQLKVALIRTSLFSSEFEDRFNQFVRDRNEFVHALWTSGIDLDERTGIPAEASYEDKSLFAVSLMRQAQHMQVVFRGMLASIIESLSEHLKDDEVVIPWRRYIDRYKATLRNPRCEQGVTPNA